MTVAGPLQSPEARQALCWAFPYDEVISGVYDGFAKRAIGPVAELCRGFSPDTFVYQTELQRARALLDRAGIAEGTVLTMLLPPGNTGDRGYGRAVPGEPRGDRVDSRHPDGRLRHLRRHLHRRPAGGGTSEPAPVLLVTRLQRCLESPLAADLVRRLAVGQWRALLQRARRGVAGAGDETPPTRSRIISSLSEIQQIVTRDDPAAIYYAQPEWLTVLRRDIEGFTPDLVVGDIVDFYALYRREPDVRCVTMFARPGRVTAGGMSVLASSHFARVTISRSKVERPSVSGQWVRRPQLEARLDRALTRSLTVDDRPRWARQDEHHRRVAAPAGHRCRLGDGRSPRCRSDPVRRPRRGCPRPASPRASRPTSSPCSPCPDRLAPRDLGERFGEALYDLERDVVLVLDDVHAAGSGAVAAFVDGLLLAAPRRLHTILSSRGKPPFPLSRLRTMGDVEELTGADLRFSPQETGELLRLETGEVG